jgi:hypothetical protein
VSLYHLLDSPPKEKALGSTDFQKGSISLSKRPYVDLKETRYENNKLEADKDKIENEIKK